MERLITVILWFIVMTIVFIWKDIGHLIHAVGKRDNGKAKEAIDNIKMGTWVSAFITIYLQLIAAPIWRFATETIEIRSTDSCSEQIISMIIFMLLLAIPIAIPFVIGIAIVVILIILMIIRVAIEFLIDYINSILR